MTGVCTHLCTPVKRFPDEFCRDAKLGCTRLARKRHTLSGVRGYGRLIADARKRYEWSPADLADRIGQSPATVYRLEAEETEPSVDQVNRLVANLPISAEELVAAMGVNLNAPSALRLPKQLLDGLQQLNEDNLLLVMDLVDSLAGRPSRRGRR